MHQQQKHLRQRQGMLLKAEATVQQQGQVAPQVNWSYRANVASLSTKFSSGSSLLVVLLAVSACCTGKMPLGAPCLPGNEVGLCPGTGRKRKRSPCDYRFLKVFFIPTESQVLTEKLLTGTGYQYFREHWYGTGLEEAEASDISCIPIPPLANLLPFPWHEVSSGLLHRFLLLSLNSCLQQGSGLSESKCSRFQLGQAYDFPVTQAERS